MEIGFVIRFGLGEDNLKFFFFFDSSMVYLYLHKYSIVKIQVYNKGLVYMEDKESLFYRYDLTQLEHDIFQLIIREAVLSDSDSLLSQERLQKFKNPKVLKTSNRDNSLNKARDKKV
jgi:hypothetical protein